MKIGITADLPPLQLIDDIPKAHAQELVKSVQSMLEAVTEDVEKFLAHVGVKHSISIYLGDYGTGRNLVHPGNVENLNYRYDPANPENCENPIGSWVSSSSLC